MDETEKGEIQFCKNIDKQVILILKDLVDYQDGQVLRKALVQNNAMSMTLFSFDKGE